MIQSLKEQRKFLIQFQHDQKAMALDMRIMEIRNQISRLERQQMLQNNIIFFLKADVHLLLLGSESTHDKHEQLLEWIKNDPQLNTEFEALKKLPFIHEFKDKFEAQASDQNEVKNFITSAEEKIKQEIQKIKQEIQKNKQKLIKCEQIKCEQMILQLNPLLVSTLIKPQEILNKNQEKLFNKFIKDNKDFEELKELPFIKKLQDDFKDQNLSDEELVEAFKRALVLQEVGIRDKIMHFLHICYKWIYETLIGPYDVKSTLEEEKRDAHNTFKSFLEATELKITNQKEV